MTMPPKKRAKLVQPELSPQTPLLLPAAGNVKEKSKSKVVKERVPSMKTRSKAKATTSTFEQAAEGAGMYTTAELQAIRKAGQNPAHEQDSVEICADDSAVNEVAPNVTQQFSPTSPSPDSSSESEGEIVDDEQPNEGSPAMSRKITYDRERQRFTATALSPGSLDAGRDTRDLAKLQEILDSNPEAINTLDAMLKAIKHSNVGPEPNSNVVNQAGPSQDASRPVPQLDRGTLNPLINQTSETTIYTNAVPSASPSQACPVGQDPMHFQDPLPPRPVTVVDSEINFVDRSQPLHHDARSTTPATEVDESAAQQQREDRSAAKARTEQLILEAQRQRIDLAQPSAGIVPLLNSSMPVSAENLTREQILSTPGSHDLKCDDQLFQLTAHVDAPTIAEIRNGVYVDLAKLLPRDRVTPIQDKGKFQIVDDDGKPAFAPYTPKDAYTINTFKRWELAFDIFAKIYADTYPRRAPELLEYKHIIRRGAESHPWFHVYNYDQIFRQHLEKNPGRTWAKKHLETWTNHVLDPKLSPTAAEKDVKRNRPPCKFFNKNGQCKRGRSCDHDHRCSFCFLFGHGRYNCHKLLKKGGATAAPPVSTAATSSASSSNNSA